MNIVCVIPARMGSSRFFGKPLSLISGKSLITRVYEAVVGCSDLSDCIVATCDEVIKNEVEANGGIAIMTSGAHERASDRCAEAIDIYEKESGKFVDVVVMVQGDEPLTTQSMVSAAVRPMIDNSDIQVVNLMAKIHDKAEFNNPDVIKVVTDINSKAKYFSRHPIPFLQQAGESDISFFGYKQVCVIPFRRDFLKVYNELPETELEKRESVDMLRIIEHGHSVMMVEIDEKTHAVDRPNDVAIVERLLEERLFI